MKLISIFDIKNALKMPFRYLGLNVDRIEEMISIQQMDYAMNYQNHLSMMIVQTSTE